MYDWEQPVAEILGSGYPAAEQPDRLPEQPDVPHYMRDLVYRPSADLPTMDNLSGAIEYPTDVAAPQDGIKIHHSIDGALQDAGKLREKLTEGTTDYLATVLGNPAFTAATQGWQTEPFPATEAIEGVRGQLQADVATPLQNLGGAVGLSSGQAAFAAGVTTNIVLAPITGPLDQAATYIEIAGIIVGLVTGAHGLALACLKLLSHSQFERLLSQGFNDLIHGSPTAGPQSDSHRPTVRPPRTATDASHFKRPEAVARPARHHAEQASPGTPCDATRQGQPRLCLSFAPKQPENPNAPARGIGIASGFYGDMHEAVVLPPGDDAFLRALPTILQSSTLSELDVPTAKTMSDLREVQYFVLGREGLGLGTRNAKPGSRTTFQHPGCRAGDCKAPGLRCPCRCSGCQRFTGASNG
jgi:hypothetical protein